MAIDHPYLKYIINKPDPMGRFARWVLLLKEYEFNINDKPSKKYIDVDACILLELHYELG